MRGLDSDQGLIAIKRAGMPCIRTKPSSAISTPPSPAATPKRWRAATTTRCSSPIPSFRCFAARKRETCGGCWRPARRTSRSRWKRRAPTAKAGAHAGDARYTFSKTGRKVDNRIEAMFAFRDGRIVRHYDRFSFWRWSSQALGPAGRFLGWFAPLKWTVRRQAAAQLDRFRQKGIGSLSDALFRYFLRMMTFPATETATPTSASHSQR